MRSSFYQYLAGKPVDRTKSIDLIDDIFTPGMESSTQNVEAAPTKKDAADEAEEGEQPCCCSAFKRKIAKITAYIKRIIIAISIIGLVKSVFSLTIFLYDIISKYFSILQCHFWDGKI